MNQTITSPALGSRRVALDILASVLDRTRPLDEAIEAAFKRFPVEPRDRAFARLLAVTCVRRLGQIDDAIGRLTTTRSQLRPPALMHVLRLGAAQLLFLETPPHAAVATSVDLADAAGLGRGKALVNAVLRRLAREGAAILAEQDSARLNLPGWLWERWSWTYGEDVARAIAAQQLVEPPLDLTLKPGQSADFWAEALGAIVLPNGTLRRPVGGRIEELPGFAEGAWWVQDAAASLPVMLLGDLTGKTAFDLCAAPGGKTAQLAAAGATVTAIDRSAQRLDTVRRNLERLSLSATLSPADALVWTPPGGQLADAVLLDAPCSATGTIRRHPDIKLAKSLESLAQLTRLQTELLDRAAKFVRPGGTLLYCTCSLEPEEGERQVAGLLASRPDLARRPIEPAEIGGLDSLINRDGDLRTLPFHLSELGGMDGFFASRLTRIL